MQAPSKNKLASPSLTLRALSDSWNASILAVLPWLIPGTLLLLVKHQLLVALSEVIKLRPNSLGSAPDAAGFWQQLSFFRMDLLIVGVEVPLGILAVFLFLSGIWRVRISLPLNLLTSLAVYIQYRARAVSGNFISLHTAWLALSWGVREPAANLSFVGNPKVIFAGGAVIALAAGGWFATRKKQMRPSSLRARPLLARCATALFVAITVLTLLSWSVTTRATPFHRSAAVLMTRAYLGYGLTEAFSGEQFEKEYSALAIPALVESYRSLTHSPPPGNRTPHWAAARGANVIFFVLETTPTRFLDFTGNLDTYPNFRQLRERSFLPQQHYTTGLLTHLALYSVFSSIYPSPAGLIATDRGTHPRIPSLFSVLGLAGYETAVYSPFHWRGANDEAMFSGLGVHRQVFPDSKIFWGAELDSANWREARIAHDRAALSLLKTDMAAWLDRGTPFLAVYTPQVGHVPLPLLESTNTTHTEREALAREHQILKMEDGWLGEILLLLEQHHQLDKTIIVVLGDHGVRVRDEDPALTPGMLDDLSYHVPLLMYAPQILRETNPIPWVTSHIDITPSLLDLLGIPGPDGIAQGAPFWDPALAHRRTLLFAQQSMGTDGYHDEDRFYMINYFSEFTYVAPQLHFDAMTPIEQYSAVDNHIAGSIVRMGALQKVIEDKLAETYRTPVSPPSSELSPQISRNTKVSNPQ